MDKIFEREAKKLLMRLNQKGACLKKAPTGFELWSVRAKKPLSIIGESFGEALLTHNLLERDTQEQLVLSDAGLHFLRRRVFPKDAYRRQHSLTEKHKNDKGESYEINMKENPLFWLRARRGRDGKAIISQNQMEAGCRLQTDFFSATAQPKMIVDLTQPYIGKQSRGFEGAPMTERAMSARARMRAALKMLGPGLGDIALEVCCYQQGLEKAERHLGWPKRAGKVVLQIALQRLVRFYKLG